MSRLRHLPVSIPQVTSNYTVPIYQANRTALIAKFTRVRGDLRISGYAAREAGRITGMSATDLVDVVCNGRAVLLPYTDGEHTYHLLFRPQLEQFFVAAVSSDEAAFLDGLPHIKDVLTVEAFESQQGEASRRFRRTAAARLLDPVTFRKWDEKTFGAKTGPKPVRVITYYRDAAGEIQHLLFTGAPVCSAYIDEHGLENSFGHPGFASWYQRAAQRDKLEILSVVSVMIADLDKVRLNIDAPAIACPNCRVRNASMPAQYVDDAKPSTPSTLSRVLGIFGKHRARLPDR